MDRIPRWERLLLPVTLIFLFWIFIRGIWQFWLYPETHAQPCDLDEESEAFQRLNAYRMYRSNIGVWRRLMEKLHLVEFDAGPYEDLR